MWVDTLLERPLHSNGRLSWPQVSRRWAAATGRLGMITNLMAWRNTTLPQEALIPRTLMMQILLAGVYLRGVYFVHTSRATLACSQAKTQLCCRGWKRAVG